MKKYLSLAIALMLAASVSACGTAENASSAAEETQKAESAAELPTESAEKAAELPPESAEKTAGEEETETTSASENAAAEAKNEEPSNAAPEENPESENVFGISEEAPGADIPEEAQDGAGEEINAEHPVVISEDPESPVYSENLPPEGVEVNIDEEAYYEVPEEEVSTPPEVAGTYTLYAWDDSGKIMKPETQNVTSTITLNEDGTGIMMFDEDKTVIREWGTSGTLFAMFYDEHGAADGTLDDGIIIIDPIDGDDILYFYAKEGVDISKVLSADREKYILED